MTTPLTIYDTLGTWRSRLNELITEVDTNYDDLIALIGNLSSLSTTDKSSIVASINETYARIATYTDGKVGNLASLTTSAKTTAVAAINEVNANTGTLSSLTTSVKTSIVAALNEVEGRSRTYYAGTVSGTANAIVITPTPAVPTLVTGMVFEFFAQASNTSTVTVKADGTNDIAVRKRGGAALVANDILNGQLVRVQYTGSVFELLNPHGYVSNASGYMGIGTTNPLSYLHVVASGTQATPTTGTVGTFHNSTTTGTNSYLQTVSGNAAYAGLLVGDTDNVAIGRYVYNHSTNAAEVWVNGTTQKYLFGSSGSITAQNAASTATTVIRHDYAVAVDSAAATQTYGDVRWVLDDPTAGTIDGGWELWLPVNNTLTKHMEARAGVISATYTGTWAGDTITVAKGGTGSTSLTANNVLLGNGTSALQVVAPGTSGNVLTSNGTTWTSAALPPSIVYNHITGYLPSSISGTNTTASMTFSAGQAVDSTNAAYITKGTTTSWAVSNGNAINGYQGGTTLPNSSTIHFFICSGGSGTGTFASTSLTPTLPAGYNTYYRRIFSFRTNGSGVIGAGTAREIWGGATIYYLSTRGDDVQSVTIGTGSRTLLTLTSVPTDLQFSPLIDILLNNNANLSLYTSPDEPDVAPATTLGNICHINAVNEGSTLSGGLGNRLFLTNTSSQIAGRSNAGSTTTSISTNGWIDFRRA